MAKPLLIVLCGLPGAGKSSLSRELARRLGALRWDKDELRELLFPGARVRHDRALNDACMELLYAALTRAFVETRIVILDGRPFTESAQRTRVREAAKQAGAAPAFVLCSAQLTVLRERISGSSHVARDRDEALLERLMARSEPFEGDAIRVDTSVLGPEDAASFCVNELRARGLIVLS